MTTCADVGEINPDVAGVGIILSFVLQGGLSFVLSIVSKYLDGWVLALDRLPSTVSDRDPPVGSKMFEMMEVKHAVDRVLYSIADTQVLNGAMSPFYRPILGIALLIGALAQKQTLSLYHYHIIYDTVNFTAVSYCCAVVNILGDKSSLIERHLLLALYGALYLTFAIAFGIELGAWDPEAPGRCYFAHAISRSNAPHPSVDRIYLAMTCLYLIVSLSASHGGLVRGQQETSMTAKHGVLQLALLQVPLHSYMLFALRASNESHLRGGSENSWGFGQVVALVSLGSSILYCVREAIGYRNAARERRQRVEHMSESAETAPVESYAVETTVEPGHSEVDVPVALDCGRNKFMTERERRRTWNGF